MEADFIVSARWIAPVRPTGVILENHALAVRHGRITEILPTGAVASRYPGLPMTELGEHLLIPGFVNAHTHAAMSLLRGLADDMPLMRWLKEHIWPAESKWLSADFVRDGSELAIAEMLLGGTTCFNDMYLFPDATARAASKFGIRASIGMVLFEFATPWAQNPAEYLQKGLAVRDEYKSEALLNFMFAPHAPYSVADESFKRIQRVADELDTGIHLHLHETASEVEDAVRETGERPLARLDRLGLLNPSLLAVHMTQLTDAEISRLADTGVKIAHCPESNLKLASGICPVTKLLDAGVNIALGTDGAASNNDLDMLGELRTMALLAKGVSGQATAVPAAQALEIATLGGARALGLEEDIGTLEPGKWADMIAVDLSHAATTPVYNPVSQLIYAASRNQISHVWVAGVEKVRDRQLLVSDFSALREKANHWQMRIAAEDSQ